MNSKLKEEELAKGMTNLLLRYDPLQTPPRSLRHLRPEDRVEASDLKAVPNQVLLGKYLLCQIISTTRAIEAFQVFVADPKGAWSMRLHLYNYSSLDKSLALGDILPPGSFLVLSNPTSKSTEEGKLGLGRCDNPAEVQLVSRKALETKFPDLIWNNKFEKEISQLFQLRFFWREIEGDKAAYEELKRLGNKGFVEKRFSDAIRFYDMAFDYCSENGKEEAIIHSNKSAALLALGCYNTALKCAETSLEVDPENEKYIYRKTKALIGLVKYEEGLNFLQQKFDQFPSLSKSKDCSTLLANVKFLTSRANIGPTDAQLLSIRKANLKDDANIPEFTGPVAISQIEGKGRGLVATEEIRTGQLLLCAKAFAYHALPPNTVHGINICKSLFKTPCGKIANKLAFDPQLGPELYNLTGGAELGHLEPGDWKLGQVDMARITGIMKTNAFGSGKVTGRNTELGLWILPSLLNHSCSEFNCSWVICGEWMSLSAIADIKKGDELTISYISPIGSYDSRLNTFNNLGFICSCTLCQLEANEPASVKNEREKILKSLDELRSDCGLEEIKGALKGVEKLVYLRKEHVPLNFSLLSPQIFQLTEILLDKALIVDFISLSNRMNEVAEFSVVWSTFGEDVAVNLLAGHALRRDKILVNAWSERLKRLAMKCYGSLEYSGIPFETLREQFGIDFFE